MERKAPARGPTAAPSHSCLYIHRKAFQNTFLCEILAGAFCPMLCRCLRVPFVQTRPCFSNVLEREHSLLHYSLPLYNRGPIPTKPTHVNFQRISRTTHASSH